MFRAVLFDLDNTLVDRDAAYARYAADLLREMGRIDEDADRLLVDILRHDANGARSRQEHVRFLADLLPGDRDADWFWRRQRERLPDFIQPNWRVRAMVARLGQRYRVAVVTNGSAENQRAKLQAAGLENIWDAVLISGEYGVAKPAPDIVSEALRRLDCRPAEACMVGDRIDCDIVPAKQLGLTTLWVQPGAMTHPLADCRLATVLQVETWLARQSNASHRA